MALNRFYQSSELRLGETTSLDKEVSHHIHRVLRLDVDQIIQLFNGDGNNYRAKITLSGKSIEVIILDMIAANNESSLKIHLGQAISKGERMDLTLQKSVELGVDAITPLLSERVQFRFDEKRLKKKMAHWQKIIISACEQSGRACIPQLHSPLPLDKWLSTSTSPGLIFVPGAEVRLMDIKPTTSLRLLVGPEGGFSDQEIQVVLHNQEFTALSLGPRVLRTETAALTALSILQAKLGDI